MRPRSFRSTRSGRRRRRGRGSRRSATLITSIHQGSFSVVLRERDHDLRHLDRGRRARPRAPSATRTTPGLSRRLIRATSSLARPVRANRDRRRRARCRASLRVRGRELDLGERPLEGERLDPLDTRAGEERTVSRRARDLRRPRLALGRRRQVGRERRGSREAGAAPAPPASASRRPGGRSGAPSAWPSRAKNSSSSEERRVDRAALALRASLEVDRRCRLAPGSSSPGRRGAPRACGRP